MNTNPTAPKKNAVDSTHDTFDQFLPAWNRARDVFAGDDALKQGDKYIPKLNGQTDPEYRAYRDRPAFYNATARTAAGLAGMIFRQPPTLTLPTEGTLKAAFEPILKDADKCGESFEAYAKAITDQVLEVGRAGSLIDWEDTEQRVYVCKYTAEQIVNWRSERINGQIKLSLVVLKEEGYPVVDGKEVEPTGAESEGDFIPEKVEQYRVLRLVNKGAEAGTKNNIYNYTVEIWQPKAKDNKEQEFVKVNTITPTRKNIPLQAIPFVFHGPRNSKPDVMKPPLEDLILINLHHFRISADFNHGLHFTALPTAWIAGFASGQEYKIGSSTAWVSDNIGATAGFLEFTGQGLGAIEKALDRDERLMAVMGSRLLEETKKATETVGAMEIRGSGEGATLMNVALAGSESLTRILQWFYWWNSTEPKPEEIPADKINCKLNTDFVSTRLTPEELNSLVKARQSGEISQDTFLYQLKTGEILKPGQTIEEEKDLIELQRPPAPTPQPGKQPVK